MKLFSSLLLVFSLILVISCAATLKQNEIDPWLNARSGGQPAQINITGRWHDALDIGAFGWGEGNLQQQGNQVSGTIGNYNVQGIVSGKTVYLVFLYRDSVYYTARLEMSQGLLTGNYFKGNDKGQTQGYPMSIARTVGTTR